MRLLSRVMILAAAAVFPAISWAQSANYVVSISIDGLGSSYLQALMAGGQVPNFSRLQNEGAWTLNARNDYDFTETLQNHTTMVTSRGVYNGSGPSVTGPGHDWWTNPSTIPTGVTIHSNKGAYVSSVFDVSHDAGLSTGIFATKPKFSLFVDSYSTKLNTSTITNYKSPAATSAFVSAMSGPTPLKYSFVHIADPDEIGHAKGWGSTEYNNAVKAADGYLGTILNTIATNPALKGHTAIILTADHGGEGSAHSTNDKRLDYTIPFMVWGPGVQANTDLYALNTAVRQEPGIGRPTYTAIGQPIRNGDLGNLSLDILGLGAIPGSSINKLQDLTAAGSTVAPPVTIAYNAFNEAPIGDTSWTPGVGATELGFTTQTLSGSVGSTTSLGTYDSSTSPRRLRMRGYQAVTTFAAVDLKAYKGVMLSIDVLTANTTYEGTDYFRVVLTNGVDTITVADYVGTGLNALTKDRFNNFSAAIPDSWTTATLKLSSLTDDGAGAEIINFDHIFFTGSVVPEPASVASGLGILALLAVRRRRRA